MYSNVSTRFNVIMKRKFLFIGTCYDKFSVLKLKQTKSSNKCVALTYYYLFQNFLLIMVAVQWMPASAIVSSFVRLQSLFYLLSINHEITFSLKEYS